MENSTENLTIGQKRERLQAEYESFLQEVSSREHTETDRNKFLWFFDEAEKLKNRHDTT